MFNRQGRIYGYVYYNFHYLLYTILIMYSISKNVRTYVHGGFNKLCVGCVVPKKREVEK